MEALYVVFYYLTDYMRGKSLYLPFGHAFEGVDSDNELQTTTKIHFELWTPSCQNETTSLINQR